MCVVSTQIDGVLHDIDQNVWVSKWCKWEEENAVDGWGFAYVEYHSLDLLHLCRGRSNYRCGTCKQGEIREGS